MQAKELHCESSKIVIKVRLANNESTFKVSTCLKIFEEIAFDNALVLLNQKIKISNKFKMKTVLRLENVAKQS